MPGPSWAGIPLSAGSRFACRKGWKTSTRVRPAPKTEKLMRIEVLTIFPEYFEPAFDSGMIRIARERGALVTEVVNLRDFTDDAHRTTDDSPFGGGAGMVMRPEPIFRAVEKLAPGKSEGKGLGADTRVILLTP